MRSKIDNMDEKKIIAEAKIAALETKREKLQYAISDMDVDNSLYYGFESVHYTETMRTLILSGGSAALVGLGSYVLTENVGVTALLSIATLGGLMVGPKLYQRKLAKHYNSQIDELDEQIAYQKQLVKSMKQQ